MIENELLLKTASTVFSRYRVGDGKNNTWDGYNRDGDCPIHEPI